MRFAIPYSSTAESRIVNPIVPGSNPGAGAILQDQLGNAYDLVPQRAIGFGFYTVLRESKAALWEPCAAWQGQDPQDQLAVVAHWIEHRWEVAECMQLFPSHVSRA